MAKNIRGNQDGENGENESYTIHGRGTVSRPQLVNEVQEGKHPEHHIVDVNGQQYVRSNPDGEDGNNVNKGT